MRKTNFWDFACSAVVLGFGYKIFKTVADSITGKASNETKKNDILDRIMNTVNDFLKDIDKSNNQTEVEEPDTECPEEINNDIPDDVDTSDLAIKEETENDNA